jgi:Ca2+-binding EF-hand superfamily protein
MRPFHALAITVLVSTLAMADVRTSEPVSEVFKALDRNTDQLISRSEAEADHSLHERFTAVDSDADGYVNEAELLARPDDRDFE